MSLNAVILRKSDRRDLVRALERLASPDPAERASAAARAVEMTKQCGATWSQLLAPAVPDDAADSRPSAWPAPALALLERPDITDEDRIVLRRLAAWRAPGKAGWSMLREIQVRAGDRFDNGQKADIDPALP